MKKILNNMAAALVLMAGVAFCTVSCQEDPITGPAEFSIVDAEVLFDIYTHDMHAYRLSDLDAIVKNDRLY